MTVLTVCVPALIGVRMFLTILGKDGKVANMNMWESGAEEEDRRTLDTWQPSVMEPEKS